MRCPYCQSEDTQVKDSRPAEDGGAASTPPADGGGAALSVANGPTGPIASR